MTADEPTRPIRIANMSGFYGDRRSAAREMVTGGDIDVLTGDYLAELTMLILAKDKRRRERGGYARTFLAQLEDVLGTCLERGVKIVTNAGGLAPEVCAEEVAALAARLGLTVSVGSVSGDDLLPRLDELRPRLVHRDTGEPLGDDPILAANVYLGAFGIVEALSSGADVVVTGRVTDASLIVGPAAWYHGWTRDDLDQLAGATAAGHVIECGPQATGGNYPFFQDIPDLRHPGYPLAEIAADGSSVITKHADTGGAVTVGTVTAQLLYEIGSPSYLSPDVTTRFDTVELDQVGPDRVSMSGVRGEPPPATVKALLQVAGGYRNTMVFGLTGLDVPAKVELVESALWHGFPGGRDHFDHVDVALLGVPAHDPATADEAVSFLRVTVQDRDEKKVSSTFNARCVELGLASYPGYFFLSPPGPGSAFSRVWPSALPADEFSERVTVDGRTMEVRYPATQVVEQREWTELDDSADFADSSEFSGEMVEIPLGRLVAARSGDKGADANLGVWADDEEVHRWLDGWLTVDRLRTLVPDSADLEVNRYRLPNLLALNFVLTGFLPGGVAACTKVDAQAKGLSEFLRSRVVEAPVELVTRAAKQHWMPEQPAP